MCNKKLSIDFMYQSITDTQLTIRAIDVKIAAIFATSMLPLTKISTGLNIFNKISSELISKNCLSSLEGISLLTSLSLLLTACIFWVLSLYLVFKSVMPLSGVGNCINGETEQNQMFYLSNCFDFKQRRSAFIDWFCNLKSNLSIQEIIDRIPKDESDAAKQLACEMVKLSYIRDLKMIRSNLAFKYTFYWLISGISSWVFYKFLITH